MFFYTCFIFYRGGGKDEKTIAVIPKDTTHSFWQSIHAGEITERIRENLKAVLYVLLLPTIVETAEVKKAVGNICSRMINARREIC